MAIQNNLKEKYITAAIIHRTESKNGGYKEVNKQYDVLTRIYRHMEKDGELAVVMISELLKHPNDDVSSWAAAHALGLKIFVDEAEKVLERISRKKDLVSLNAEMTLKVWRERGYLKF